MGNHSAIDLNKLIPVVEEFKGIKGTLVPILQKIEEIYGYLPEESIFFISKELKIPVSKIFGVMTFYAQFHFTPRGRNKIMICRGTACHVQGGAKILEEVEKQLGIKPGETTSDREYTLETVACIGACALAPTMVINNKTYGKLTPKKIEEIFKHKCNKEGGEADVK